MKLKSPYKNPKFKYIDFYSNGIIFFIVIQGLTFLYTFGVEETFNKKIKEHVLLLIALLIIFLIVLIGAVLSLIIYRKNAIALFDEIKDKKLVSFMFYGKIFTSILFGTMPIGILVFFGLLTVIS